LNRKIIFYFLSALGAINSLTIIVSAVTGPNAYTIANSISQYLDIMICYIPLALTIIALTWYFIDLYLKPDKKVNYFQIAFLGISADAVFVIGSVFFGQPQ
jgi:hypothetical protein